MGKDLNVLFFGEKFHNWGPFAQDLEEKGSKPVNFFFRMLPTKGNTRVPIPYFANHCGRKTEISSSCFLNTCPVWRRACEWTLRCWNATYHTVQCYLNVEVCSFVSPRYEMICQGRTGKCVSCVPGSIDKPPDPDCCETQSWHKTNSTACWVWGSGFRSPFLCGIHLTCWCWPLTVVCLGHLKALTLSLEELNCLFIVHILWPLFICITKGCF